MPAVFAYLTSNALGKLYYLQQLVSYSSSKMGFQFSLYIVHINTRIFFFEKHIDGKDFVINVLMWLDSRLKKVKRLWLVFCIILV